MSQDPKFADYLHWLVVNVPGYPHHALRCIMVVLISLLVIDCLSLVHGGVAPERMW